MKDAQAAGTSNGPKHEAETARSLVALGQAVRRHRERRGMSVEALARAAGEDRRDVRAIEAGDLDLPYEMLVALARALDIPTSSLVLEG